MKDSTDKEGKQEDLREHILEKAGEALDRAAAEENCDSRIQSLFREHNPAGTGLVRSLYQKGLIRYSTLLKFTEKPDSSESKAPWE